MSFFRVLLEGPIYIPRLWIWSWKKAKKEDKIWIFFETAWACIIVLLALCFWKQTPALLIYTGLVVAGTWIFPLMLVYTPHNASGKDALTQTRVFRGRFIPALLLQHTYRLEHHLYPMVPAHNWLKLSRMLDPYFQKKGIQPIRIP